MRVISVHQPWAQLIADRRRHIIFKNWQAEPGEYELHASHVVNKKKCVDFGYENPDALPKNAIIARIEVKRCYPRLKARKSGFDYHKASVAQESLVAIAVKTIEKYRHPTEVMRPKPKRGETYWEF